MSKRQASWASWRSQAALPQGDPFPVEARGMGRPLRAGIGQDHQVAAAVPAVAAVQIDGDLAGAPAKGLLQSGADDPHGHDRADDPAIRMQQPGIELGRGNGPVGPGPVRRRGDHAAAAPILVGAGEGGHGGGGGDKSRRKSCCPQTDAHASPIPGTPAGTLVDDAG